jgi:phage gp16-like protein
MARTDLDFDDGDYRALLERVTGLVSSTAMNIGQLGKVLDEFARLGWSPRVSQAGKPARKPRAADHPTAKKARAMLISLGLLGAIRDTSEGALEAFASRQLGTDRLQWADQAQVYKLIEALKAIATRHGWDQSVAGLSAPIWTLKLRLCEAILRRLIAAGGERPETTIATVAADRLGVAGNVLELNERQLEAIAAYLGTALADYARRQQNDD